MTRDQIIESVFYNQALKDWIARLQRNDLREDLKQEIMEALLMKEEHLIIRLHQEGKLIGYSMRMALHMCSRSRSRFNKTYKTSFVEVPMEVQEIFVTEQVESNESEVMEAVEELPWYDREILKLYANLGSCRAVEAKTSIPRNSVNLTVRNAAKIVRQKITE